jgi:hypothetical protein
MLRASDWFCPFEGIPADHCHHLTGIDLTGRYHDENLVMPLCAQQHRVEHQVWNMLGIGDGYHGSPNWLRLRRISAHLVRLGEHNRDGVVIWPAETAYQIGLTLGRIAEDFDPGDGVGGSP